MFAEDYSITKALDVMVSSYDVYDVVPWHEMKQDLYIGSMPNESPHPSPPQQTICNTALYPL